MTTTGIADIYDHEVASISQLLELLNGKARSKKLNYSDFEREIKDRFAAIGFTVDVNWYRFGHEQPDGRVQEVEGAAMPEITVTGRTAKIAFDHDRQVHEAVHNILEIPGSEGWIKTDPETLKRFLGEQGHSHGHGHHH